MKVRDVMTSPAVTAPPETSFKDLCDVLIAHDVSGIPIVDRHGAPLGIVTEADLVTKEAYGGTRRPLALVASFFRGRDPQWVRKAAGLTAADVMTSPVLAIRPTASLDEAARLMLERGVNRLPVVEDGRVVGVVARHDLLEFFSPRDAEIRAAVEEILDDPLNDPGRYDVTYDVHDGVVVLEGSAYFESDAKSLREMVRHVPGVVAVEGNLACERRDERVGPFV